MKVLPSAVLTVIATMFLSFFTAAVIIKLPSLSDSRGMMIVAIGLAGVILSVLPFRGFRTFAHELGRVPV